VAEEVAAVALAVKVAEEVTVVTEYAVVGSVIVLI
tara:strand:- start:218 stop:322 length:105 start_codon:yes stop_codon:yes gene_type:complete